jgi:hypothetical protein
MSNPWLKKNPFLSLWLSAVNGAAGSWRSHATAQMKRQAGAATKQITKDAVDAWWGVKPKPAAKKRRKR